MFRINLFFTLLIVFTHSLFAQESWIRINQAGYTQKSVKVAVLGSFEDISINSFEIVDVLSGETVYHGRNIRIFEAYACFTKIFRWRLTQMAG